MKQRWIGLLDCNNFFVSCERLFRPDLMGKPVVVLSSNDGCVVARSQEIKDIGVPMGVPYFQIKDTLKKCGATTFSSHFALYRDISRRVMAVLRQELDLVEQYSVDEAFFSVEADPAGVADRVKLAVERQVGIPVSVGIAPTKTQAKYANALAKKGGGVRVLDQTAWNALSPTITLADIWGVGGRLELRYKQHGLLTAADLMAADSARIDRLFGITGLRLQQELQGRSVLSLLPLAEPQQSIMSSRSFQTPTTEKAVVADALAYHVRHAVADLRAMGQAARLLRIMIRPSRHGDFFLRGTSKEAILPAPTNDTITFLRQAGSLLEDAFESGVPYQKAGVQLGLFSPVGAEQASLFKAESPQRNDRLLAVIDALNRREGKEVVLVGSRLKSASWHAKAEARSPAYTTRWSDVAIVKAI